jgi:hypothetical protein
MTPAPNLLRIALSVVGLSLPCWAQAHDGHGLFASHWHATDVLGFIALALGLSIAWWMTKK